jgi:acyl-CoA reductase-like NAD-dependent aldehyde dehydrogenase
VLVAREIAGAFTQKLVDRARSLRIGPGTDPQTQMGPVCGTAQLETVLGYIESGVREGATLLTGGNQLSAGALSEGCFIEPTIFGAVTPQMTIAREEIFGPVLCVMEVDNLEHALEVSNAIEYGLAASIYTRDLAAALRFVEGIEAGLTHINMISAYKEPALPFGGFKQSGHGLPEAGRSGAEFFTDEKAVYIQP